MCWLLPPLQGQEAGLGQSTLERRGAPQGLTQPWLWFPASASLPRSQWYHLTSSQARPSQVLTSQSWPAGGGTSGALVWHPGPSIQLLLTISDLYSCSEKRASSLYMSLGSKLMTHFWWQDSWFNLCTEAPFWPPTEHSSTPWTGDYVSSPAHHTSLIKPWGGPCFPSIFKLGQFLDHPLMSMPTLSLHDGTLPQWLIGPWILLFPWSSWTLIVAAHQDFCWGKHLGTSRNTPPTHHHHYKDQSVYF